jgi:hypothetical protein
VRGRWNWVRLGRRADCRHISGTEMLQVDMADEGAKVVESLRASAPHAAMAPSRCQIRSWGRKRQWRVMALRIEPFSSGGTRRWRRRKRHRCAALTGRMRGGGHRASAVGQRRHPTSIMWRMCVAVIAMRAVRGMTRDRPGMVEVQGVWSDMRGRRMRGTEPARAEEVLQLLAPGRVEMSRVVAALYVKASALRSLGGYA